MCNIYYSMHSWYFYCPAAWLLSKILSPASASMAIIPENEQRIEAASKRIIKSGTIAVSYLQICYFLILLLPNNAVTSANIFMIPCVKEDNFHVFSWFSLVVFYFQIKATLKTVPTKRHDEKWIQMIFAYHMVFWLSWGEPPKCEYTITLIVSEPPNDIWTINVFVFGEPQNE